VNGTTGIASGRMNGEGVSGRSFSGFKLQAMIVQALLLREMQTRFGRNQLGFLWLFIEPLLLAAAIGAFKWATEIGQTIPGVSIFVLTLVGYLPYFTFRAIVGRAPGTLKSNMTLLYHARIKLLDVVLARHLLEMAAVFTVMTFLAIGVMIWADMVPAAIPTLVLALILLFLFSNGLGLMAAAASAVSVIAERLIQPMVYLSLPFSGALMALHQLDPAFRGMLLWNPQTHLHEMIRHGFFGDALPSYFSIAYVCFWVAVLNLIGLAALRAVRPKLSL
jgi:capsular polysaccharide transport system permease protein